MTRGRAGATRRRLIEQAVRHFGKRGYDGTSLDQVAGAAGVRKQTLLYYFPTKEALLEACMAEVSARVALELAEALAEQESNARKAETVIRAVFRLAEEWPDVRSVDVNPLIVADGVPIAVDALVEVA